MKRASLVVAALALPLVGCGGPTTDGVAPDSTSATHVAVVRQPSKPKHRVTFTTSCQDAWPLVFQTSPPRLVSEVYVRNRGTAASWVYMKTTWFYFGGGSTSKIVGPIRLQPGQRERLAISKPVSQSVLSRMVGWKHGDRMCRTTGTSY